MSLNHITIDGITYQLTVETKEAVAVPSTLSSFVAAPVPPKPVVAQNPFSVGQYVTVKTPKRIGHRVSQSGKIIAMTPIAYWASSLMPEVYVEFANSASGCGSAKGRVTAQHGCRMPVSGLVLANGH